MAESAISDGFEKRSWHRFIPILFYVLVMGVVYQTHFRFFFSRGWAEHGDGLLYQWNFWWLNKSLFGLGISPYHCDYIFAPVGVSLAFHDFTPLYGLLSLPLQAWLPLGVIYNLMIVFIMLLSAMGAYWLCFELSGQRNAALIGGLIYAFNPYTFKYGAQISVMSVQWLPLVLLFWFRADKRQKPLYAAACGLFMAASFYCSFNQTIFIVLALLYFMTVQLGADRSWKKLRSLFRSGAILALVFLGAVFPVLIVIWEQVQRFGFYAACSPVASEMGSVDLIRLVLPDARHPLWGEWIKHIQSGLGLNNEWNFVYLGILPLVLSALALGFRATRPQAWSWAGLGGLILLLAMGPTLLIMGQRPLGSTLDDRALFLPFYYLTQLPGFSALREPRRIMIVVYLALAVLTTLTLTRFSRFRDRETGSLLCRRVVQVCLLLLLTLIIVVDYLPIPRSTPFLEASPIYSWLAERKTTGSLLYIPSYNLIRAQRRIDHYHERQILYLQTVHQKPMTTGYVSRRPNDNQLALPRPFLLNQIARLQNGAPLPDGATFSRLLRELPFALALLNVDTIVLDADRLPAASASLMRTFMQRLLHLPETKHEDNISIWEIPASILNPKKYTVDFIHFCNTDPIIPLEQVKVIIPGSPVITPENSLRLALPPVWQGKLEIEVKFEPQNYEVDLLLTAHGQQLCYSTSESGLESGYLRATLPASSNGHPHWIRIDLIVKSPRSILTNPGPGQDLPQIVTYSAGMDAGNVGWCQIDDLDFVADQRGYCLIALNRDQPDQSEMNIFDTHADPLANDQLVEWIDALPHGTIVVGMIFDEATANLSESAVKALRKLGCAADLRTKFRWSHTFIGQKGLESGQAIENYGPGVSSVSSRGIVLPLTKITLERIENSSTP
ncbi:glycosyltransferase family 39 protein [bacterium]|nr:glycosyltransferase family 39 protein [bacterium]